MFAIRFTAAEREAIAIEANARGLDLGSFVRMAALLSAQRTDLSRRVTTKRKTKPATKRKATKKS